MIRSALFWDQLPGSADITKSADKDNELWEILKKSTMISKSRQELLPLNLKYVSNLDGDTRWEPNHQSVWGILA